MSKARLILALLSAIVLIGGATWFRFANAKANEASLVAVEEEFLEIATDDTYINDFLATSSQVSTLSDTDLVGRQLFGEYMSLVSDGKATPENINGLASKYASNIISLKKTAPLSTSDITVVPDNQASIASYSGSVLGIYERFGVLVRESYAKHGEPAMGNADFYAFIAESEALYRTMADDLRAIPVPNSLASTHLRLINNYRESADAMFSIKNAESDPVNAYAALQLQAKNGEEAESLYGQIRLRTNTFGL